MKLTGKNFIELTVTALFVLLGTAITYSQLQPLTIFWNTQVLWNIGLILCWAVVAFGYYHQGWMISEKRNSSGVSAFLPAAVFFVQCILFIKGIYYKDNSLILGALIVNSGVTYNIYQIFSYRIK